MSDAVQEIATSMITPPPQVKEEAQTASEVRPDDRSSSKLELLIRREQAAVSRERQAKERSQELQSALDKIKDFEEAKKNPKRALEMLGLSYDELTKSLLSDGEIPPEVEIKKLKDEFNALRESQTEAEQRRLEEEKRKAESQQQQAITNFKDEISQYINDNASRYEITIFDGHIDEVFDLIDTHYERTKDPETGVGKIMQIAEAADKIEEYYEKRELEKKKLSKLQSLWGAVPPKTLTEAIAKKDPLEKPTKTLTNNMSATPTKPTERPQSEDQRVRQIVAQFMASKRR